MLEDVSPILKSWPYDPENSVRKITSDDGTEKLQVRLPLGIEQYEIDGRPDGSRPHGFQSFLEYHMYRLKKHLESSPSNRRFRLSHKACDELMDEGVLYYRRYVVFFQIGEYPKTVRDTERNLALFDFVKQYARDEDDRVALEQHRPYLIRMRHAAAALQSALRDDYDSALRELHTAVRLIELLPDSDAGSFKFERQRSLAILRGMATELRRKKPLSKEETLKRRLQEAIRRERYEDAAVIRDRLGQLHKPDIDAADGTQDAG